MSNTKNRPLFRGIETTLEIVRAPDEEEPENRRLYAVARIIGGVSMGLLSAGALLFAVHAMLGTGGLYLLGMLVAVLAALVVIIETGILGLARLITFIFAAWLLFEFIKAGLR